jgi:chemotaxis protein methyltransferase CheR
MSALREAAEPRLTDAEFRTISRILHQDSGIALAPSKMALVYSRLVRRLRALGLRSFADYCALVAGEGGREERHEMLAALTTNVTHFFRENHHFEHLRTRLLPPLVARARQGGRVRLWSAGCSNGHEPYSIALTLLGLMPDAADHDIRILASDIDPNVVAFGERGIYDDEALAEVPKALRVRWFRRRPVASDGVRRAEVAQEMRRLVVFRELNLIGAWPMRGRFDAVFCRNVTIYFDAPTREEVWRRFAGAMEPGGWLYIGHSERLAGPAAALFSLEGTTAYRFTGEAAR